MKRIMVLAGGPDQAALINEIKSTYTDSYVVLIDMNSQVVASRVADKHIVISTMDFSKVRQAAIDEQIDMIITACGDQPLLTMGIVSEELNLPCYLSKSQILNLTNKKYMKRLMIENDIPTSKYKSFNSVEEIDDSGLSYPLIVKPADSNGSKGVRKVRDRKELSREAEASIKFSISNTIIVEEYVDGEDVSSDFYVSNGKVYHMMDCLSNKYKPNDEIAVIYQSLIPPPVNPDIKEKLQSIAEKIARVFGIKNSPLIIQTIVKGDNIHVIEFSARLGGGAKYKTIETVTGYNVLKANLRSMMGETPEVVLHRNNKLYSRCHLYTKGGILSEIKGLEKAQCNGLIEDYFVNRVPGAALSFPTSSGDRVASILFSAPSIQELKAKITEVMNSIEIISDEGKDIFLREMYTIPVKNANGI